jgi:tagatose 1,6-diphosphate aldolase
MMAIDQRDSMREAIRKKLGDIPSDEMFRHVARIKELVTKHLAKYATAVLTDPVYGYPYSIQHLPPRTGLLLAYEESPPQRVEVNGNRERRATLIEGWSVEKAVRAGADAIKLLVHYRPDASEATCRHQQDIVRQVGEECERYDVPFLLEFTGYDLVPGETKTPEYARKRPQIVIESVREFSKPEYKVDILKVEFPADLKFVKEFASGAFDGQERPAVYTLKDVEEFCRQLNEAAGSPWVILSAGVDIEEFLVQVEMACEAGASGFLCGRAIWKGVLECFPDEAKMEEWLATEGAYNFVRANAYAETAKPWFEHPKFGGQLELAGKSPSWFADYATPVAVAR